MSIQINQELCLGCGICMDSCQSGAIFMNAQRALIDIDLCNICEVCINACPNEAIALFVETPQFTPIPFPDTVNIPANEIGSQPQQLDSTAHLKENKPLGKAIVSFFGSEVGPRLVEMAISVLDRRLTQSTIDIRPEPKAPLQDRTENIRMKRRRIRLRGRAGFGSEFSEIS